MREIKFRAWNNILHEMVIVNKLIWQNDICLAPLSEDNLLPLATSDILQFTGHQDRNGIEIYEGDIVLSSLWNAPFTVDFKNGAFQIYNINLEQYLDDKKLEVIGNIYENPELLEDK